MFEPVDFFRATPEGIRDFFSGVTCSVAKILLPLCDAFTFLSSWPRSRPRAREFADNWRTQLPPEKRGRGPKSHFDLDFHCRYAASSWLANVGDAPVDWLITSSTAPPRESGSSMTRMITWPSSVCWPRHASARADKCGSAATRFRIRVPSAADAPSGGARVRNSLFSGNASPK